ncbi:MAG: proline dehydrogenase family protein [Balneola sp.]
MQELLTNTETAYKYKSTNDLKLAKGIYSIMHKYPDLVLALSKLGMFAVKWRLPFADLLVYKTFYKIFCGGVDLKDSISVVDNIAKYGVETVLDYGAEAKDNEEEYEAVTLEFLKALRFASNHDSIPLISIKITALADFELLERYSSDTPPTSHVDTIAWEHALARFELICRTARDSKVSIFVDAEESWIQGAIDTMVLDMMRKFNTDFPTIYNTYQLYLKTSYNRLTNHHQELSKDGVIFGAKIVRGAYMDKEATRAEELGIENPVYPTKGDTDDAYNEAILYGFRNHQNLAFCCATHNRESCILLMELIKENKLEDHPNMFFCQLYGMSDNLTFNLATQGVRSMKYLPYGSVQDTFPYLVRRAHENTSITNDATREYLFLDEELERRKKAKKSS